MSANMETGARSRIRNFMIWGAVAACLIIAIVAISIPPYGDYTPKAKISEALLGLFQYRDELAAFYLKHKKLPKDASEAAISLTPTSRYIRQIIYDGTSAELRAVIQDIPHNQGKTLVLKTESSGEQLKWRCFSDDIAPDYLPGQCRQR